MPIPATPYIWFNGKLVAWEKATVHVLAHALHYGSSVFEGIRAYETPKGVAIFRLLEHTRRLFDSAKIYRIALPFSADQINDACRQVVAVNSLAQGAYIRPIAFRGYGEIGVAPKIDPPVDVAIAAWEWGKLDQPMKTELIGMIAKYLTTTAQAELLEHFPPRQEVEITGPNVDARPRDAARDILNEFVTNPVQFLEQAFGRPAGP